MTSVLSVAWLIGLIVAPIAIYWFVIRPKATIGETATEVAEELPPNVGVARWLWETAKRFRTLALSFVGILITVLPDLLQMLAGIDYQQVLPAPWSIFAGPAVTIALLLVRASATTPPGEPPSKEA